MTLALFALGAVLMRGAGCIVNDIADREFDAKVERTKHRPLASGELSVWQADMLLVVLLLLSLIITMVLGKTVVMWAALSLLPITVYPLMKRVSWWPQFFLGLTFNWGALMGWAAVQGHIEWPAIALYIGCVFWTLGYDTIYAHQDKEDDSRIGVKSTALRLGTKTKSVVALFYALAVAFWVAANAANLNPVAFSLLAITALQLSWQIVSVNLDDPVSCRRVFISNGNLGWLVFASFLAQ